MIGTGRTTKGLKNQGRAGRRKGVRKESQKVAGMSHYERKNVLCVPRNHLVLLLTQSMTQSTEVLRGSEEYSRFWGNCPRFEVKEHRKQNTCTLGPL